MNDNYIKSPFSETWLENGIIVQNINPEIKEINLVIAQQLIADRKNVAQNCLNPFPVLVYANNAINIHKEAKLLYDTEEPYTKINAIAMVIDNYIASFVARFVFSIKRNKVPTEVFNNSDKAQKWLKQFTT